MLDHFIELNNRVLDRFSPRSARTRRPHVSRRRPRLRPQRRRPLQRPAAEHVQDERRLFPDPVGQRARQGPGVQVDRGAQPRRRQRRSADVLHWGDVPEPAGGKRAGNHDPLVRAANFIPKERLGSTDDCGFSPFSIDEKPNHGSPDYARDVAFKRSQPRGGNADGGRTTRNRHGRGGLIRRTDGGGGAPDLTTLGASRWEHLSDEFADGRHLRTSSVNSAIAGLARR